MRHVLLGLVVVGGFGGFTPATAKPAAASDPKKAAVPEKGVSKSRAARPAHGVNLRAHAKANALRPRMRRVRPLPSPYPDPCPGVESLDLRSGAKPFGIGEELGYELTVAGAYVGRLEMKVGKPRTVSKKTVIPLFGRARTNGFVSTFKSFEGRYMAMVDPKTLAPVGVRVEATYGEDPRWEKVLFGPDKASVGANFFLKGREYERNYQSDHDLTDILTLLYVARTVNVAQGMKACQDVFGARRLWRMTAQVAGEAKVSTPVGDQKTWFVKTHFDRKPTPGLNNKKRPHLEVDIYLAKDSHQTPLQFVVRMKGVEAKGALVRWSTKGSSKEADWTL